MIADEHKDYSCNTIATLLCCGRKRIADRELLIKEVDAVEKRRNAGKTGSTGSLQDRRLKNG
ncbi:MAG: hypothetical protein ACOCXT_04825 [Candidatus Dojkabacteria bacterium]